MALEGMGSPLRNAGSHRAQQQTQVEPPQILRPPLELDAVHRLAGGGTPRGRRRPHLGTRQRLHARRHLRLALLPHIDLGLDVVLTDIAPVMLALRPNLHGYQRACHTMAI